MTVQTGLEDFCGAAVALVDRTLRVRAANRRANAILPMAGRDSLLQLLSAHRSTGGESLRRDLEEAVTGTQKRVFLAKSIDGGDLICRVVPVPDDGEPAALVFLVPLLSSDEEAIPHLKSIYGLTQAEAEVALQVGAGLDMVQIARARSVSIHTLRAQIVAIKEKMELSRMTEIAVRVNSIAAASTML
jgi:DNA-binding CsgD family transcriptional regulator